MDEKEIKLLFLKDKIIISEVLDLKNIFYTLKNPMIIEYSLDHESRASFRYLPWQIISDDETIEINSSEISIETKPKKELEDVYRNINATFKT